MILDGLLDSAYHVSLRGSGAKLEVGSQQQQPLCGGKSRGPSGPLDLSYR